MWTHVLGIALFAYLRGFGLVHSATEGVILAVFAIAATGTRFSRKVRASIASIGLLTASALVVHVSGGVIEMHFHFFVVLGVISLYQDWTAFLIAVSYVAAHHGLGGLLSPSTVYNHPDAVAHPFKWALIHAAFVLGASIASLISWRVNETYRHRAETALRQQAAVTRLGSSVLEGADDIALMQEGVHLLASTLGVEDVRAFEYVATADRLELRASHGASRSRDSAAVPAGRKLMDLLVDGHPGPLAADACEVLFGPPPHGITADESGPGVAVSIRGNDAPYGVLALRPPPGRTACEGDLRFLQLVAQTLSAGVRQRASEDSLRHQALHDPLTGLANRALFRDRLEHAVSRAERSEVPPSVLFLDLDDFKSVNDTLGHDVGDDLLVQVARRLRGCLRDADTVARLGGDEFAVLLESATRGEAGQVAIRILSATKAPFHIGGKEIRVSSSIGIAGGDDGDVDHLMRDADVAMYMAKAQGKGRFEFFETEMQQAVLRRVEVAQELTEAIEREDLVLHYQPMIELSTGRVIGAEALVRWPHRGAGLVPPSEFIPLAEETGLVVPLGRWVLREATRQVAHWQQEWFPNMALGVNVSARQFQDPAFVDDVLGAVAAAGLAPGTLILEITESLMMQDAASTVEKLMMLRDAQIRVAIDDFGTGYSSLAYLRQFPIDILKIDKSFVARINDGPEEASLLDAIVKLAGSLGVTSCAEGVESEGQLAALRDMGCDCAQGYLFSRPVTAAALEGVVRQHESRARLLARYPIHVGQ